MLAADYQVVDVLMLVGNVGPIALYFLVLGLVNSHGRPYLVSTRADFIALTCVLMPMLLWPLPDLLRPGGVWAVMITGVLAAALFVWLLATTSTGFVIYNISEARCVHVLDAALRSLGLGGRWVNQVWHADGGNLVIHLRKFALLRNVTVHIESRDAGALRLVPRIGAEIERRLTGIAQLPSTMGACLVLIGVGLMILPMWMVGRHIHDLVDAMSHLFG